MTTVEALPGEDAYDVYRKRLQRSNYSELPKELREVVRRRKNVKKWVDTLSTSGQKHYGNAVELQLARKELGVALDACRLSIVKEGKK